MRDVYNNIYNRSTWNIFFFKKLHLKVHQCRRVFNNENYSRTRHHYVILSNRNINVVIINTTLTTTQISNMFIIIYIDFEGSQTVIYYL